MVVRETYGFPHAVCMAPSYGDRTTHVAFDCILTNQWAYCRPQTVIIPGQKRTAKLLVVATVPPKVEDSKVEIYDKKSDTVIFCAHEAVSARHTISLLTHILSQRHSTGP